MFCFYTNSFDPTRMVSIFHVLFLPEFSTWTVLILQESSWFYTNHFYSMRFFPLLHEQFRSYKNGFHFTRIVSTRIFFNSIEISFNPTWTVLKIQKLNWFYTNHFYSTGLVLLLHEQFRSYTNGSHFTRIVSTRIFFNLFEISFNPTSTVLILQKSKCFCTNHFYSTGLLPLLHECFGPTRMVSILHVLFLSDFYSILLKFFQSYMNCFSFT